MKNGPYELVIAPDDFPGKKYRGRYCYEHTLVWWQNTGEVPGEYEIIHHKNRNKRDNRFENFELLTKAEHNLEHCLESNAHKRTPEIDVSCTECNKLFRIIEYRYKCRLRASKCGKLFCSLKCGRNYQYKNIQKENVILHGNENTYSYRKCRCVECKAAHAAKARAYRAKSKCQYT